MKLFQTLGDLINNYSPLSVSVSACVCISKEKRRKRPSFTAFLTSQVLSQVGIFSFAILYSKRSDWDVVGGFLEHRFDPIFLRSLLSLCCVMLTRFLNSFKDKFFKGLKKLFCHNLWRKSFLKTMFCLLNAYICFWPLLIVLMLRSLPLKAAYALGAKKGSELSIFYMLHFPKNLMNEVNVKQTMFWILLHLNPQKQKNVCLVSKMNFLRQQLNSRKD